MKKVVTTDAQTEQLTLAEAKTHLRVIDTDDDTYITSLITTARKVAENHTGQHYGEQSIKMTFTKEDEIESILELAHPFTEMTSLKYTLDGTDTAITDYSVRDDYLILAEVPTFDTLEVVFKAGKDAPTSVKQGMLLIIGHYYENREATTEIRDHANLPMGIEVLFGTDKEWP